MKKILILCFGLISTINLSAQEKLILSRDEAEKTFIQNNLLLLSEQLKIESQKAEVIQAKLWPNPEFSISEVNLWATQRQTGGQEVSPPFFGNVGSNQQVAFQVEQLVQTAGKRKKLIALEQIDVSKAEQYFEDVLRGLKLELRNLLTELQFTQQTINLHQQLIQQIATLTNAYKNQLDKGYISKAEYTRLKAEELEINKALLDLHQTSISLQKEIKMLLRINPAIQIEITEDGYIKNTLPYQSIFINQLSETAKNFRPDYKVAILDEAYAHQLLSYEKAQRIPDLTFGMNYDRNGSTMLNFVGFGVKMDLPFFNRNNGNIKKAKIEIENARILKEHTAESIENEIVLSVQSLQQSIAFLNNIDQHYEADLDLLLNSYTKNFSQKNVSMIEYLDFMDAYLENKKIILSAHKDINLKAEELNYTYGKDL